MAKKLKQDYVFVDERGKNQKFVHRSDAVQWAGERKGVVITMFGNTIIKMAPHNAGYYEATLIMNNYIEKKKITEIKR